MGNRVFRNSFTESTLSSETFSRRIVVPMATMIIVAVGLVLGFVVVSASGQNRLEVSSSTQLAETALKVNQRQMARNLRDYAVWEDVYRNLHLDLNFAWASTDGNVGANIYEGLTYEMAFVVNPAGETVYSVVEGVPSATDAASPIREGLPRLISAARAAFAPAVALLGAGDRVYMVAAQPILPPSIDKTAVSAGDLSTLVFVKTLDAAFLSRMSDEYLLEDLRIVPRDTSSLPASVPLVAADGEVLAYLTWKPATPGYELLRLLLPPLALALVVLAAFAWLVVNNARRSTRALEDSARTVESFAQTLQESEARFRDVAEASSDWIWECDPELRFIFFSARFSKVTGISAASVLGKPLQQFFSSDAETDGWARLLSGTHKQSTFRDLRCFYRDVAGNTRICRLAGRPIIDSHQGFIGYRGTATDITEEVEAQARANHLALHDSLTGLPNRVMFREKLEAAFEGRRRDAQCVAVLCLDLDHFKEVNDTLGHAIGDALLIQVADRLRLCVRPSDTVARLGGDEFAIIQLGVQAADEAAALSLRVVEIMREPFIVEGQEIHIGVSVGAAVPQDERDDPDNLLKCADIALYRAKQSGRGAVRFFEAKMDMELQARKSLESELRHALSRDQFVLNYQPLVDLRSERVVAAEALLRWHHPEQGLVSPAVFIPIAEKCGLITPISEWVLRTACSQVQKWPDMSVAVNLSPVHFRSRDLIDTVSKTLKETGLPPERLELEITESVLIKDTEAALDILTALKALGVRIAMDDFGTGYSSLGYLNSFPFDKLKIDRSFISSLEAQEKSRAIVRSVLSLGESLQMTITAEGVEELHQVEFLVREGCHQVQGYYFSRPIAADELTVFLRNWRGFGAKGVAA